MASSSSSPPPPFMPRRRTLAVGGGLLAVAGLFGGLTAAAESASNVTPRLGVENAGPRAVTPVLSARRVPEFLVRPQAARRLRMALVPAMVGVPETHCVVVASGAETLFAANPATPMAAASNQKIVTAIAALDTLGADTRLTTRVAATAAPVDGVVNGDLWVVGGGDPAIDSATYQATLRFGPTPHTSAEGLTDQIVAAGVRQVTGGVRGDASRYDDQRVVPTWPDRYLTQNQVGPLSSLAMNDGKTVAVLPGPAPTPRPAEDPAAAFASSVTQLLQARGVTVTGAPASGVAPESLATVVEVPSLTVGELVGQMLTWSDNNTAELLVKEIGREVKGEGSTAAGLQAVRDDLAERELPLDGIELVDGSGLDPTNRLTCSLLIESLASDGPDGPLANGLAVGGETGTLSDDFVRSPARGRVRAKTGTLRGVSALSGWVETDRGADVRFAIVLNAPSGDLSAEQLSVERRLPEALLSYPDAVDPATLRPEGPR